MGGVALAVITLCGISALRGMFVFGGVLMMLLTDVYKRQPQDARAFFGRSPFAEQWDAHCIVRADEHTQDKAHYGDEQRIGDCLLYTSRDRVNAWETPPLEREKQEGRRNPSGPVSAASPRISGFFDNLDKCRRDTAGEMWV